jgi:uncharacterized membrane protein
MSSVCTSCGAAIVWATTPRGQLPVDVTPSVEGTIELQYAGQAITAIEHAGSNGAVRGSLHTSHLNTCPFQKQRGAP